MTNADTSAERDELAQELRVMPGWLDETGMTLADAILTSDYLRRRDARVAAEAQVAPTPSSTRWSRTSRTSPAPSRPTTNHPRPPRADQTSPRPTGEGAGDRQEQEMSNRKNALERAAHGGKPSAGKAAWNLARGVAFTTVQVLAALELDGWLSWGLWVIAAWNVLVLTITFVSLAAIAAEAVEKERRP